MLKSLSGTSVLKTYLPEQTQRFVKALITLCILCVSLWTGVAQSSEAKLVDEYPVYQRAQDLNYGQVLFQYHQGHFFEALSALNVAKLRSGIQGHGQHPELVEGGLMLSYGMVEEAKLVFETLLTKQISLSDRNQAWYYLGKVFYLTADDKRSSESFDKVQMQLLRKEKPHLFHEMLYMKGLLIGRDHSIKQENKPLMLASLISQIPPGNLWRQYLQYNAAVGGLAAASTANYEVVRSVALRDLKRLAAGLLNQIDELYSQSNDVGAGERINLREQCLLSLGQLYLQQGDNQSALGVLREIRKDSLLSDQALFAYSVAATNLGQHGLALEALTLLKERPQFTPWLQQVPYALSYLYEQMGETKLALQSYRVAVEHYESLQERFGRQAQEVDESRLIAALNLSRPLGDAKLVNDAYGMLNVQPNDYSFAHLLATDAFQRQVSELHELYKLEESLSQWASQLDSFDTMMATRIALREDKIQQTKQAMENQDAAHWEDEQDRFAAAINHASETEDLRFFMNEEQIKYAKKIEQAESSLALIPHDHRKRSRYERRLNRVKAYYDWWLSESFSDNRWQAVKQLRALDREMAEFNEYQAKLRSKLESDGGNEALAKRVSEGREQLALIRTELDQSLAQARNKLVALAKQDYEKQIAEAGVYLKASRESLARISDQVYHSDSAEKTSMTTEEASL